MDPFQGARSPLDRRHLHLDALLVGDGDKFEHSVVGRWLREIGGWAIEERAADQTISDALVYLSPQETCARLDHAIAELDANTAEQASSEPALGDEVGVSRTGGANGTRGLIHTS